MRSILFAALCLSCLTFTSASAREGGLILSAELAWSGTSSAIDLPLDNPQLPAWNQAFDDSDLAWGAALGWQINNHISVHFGHMGLGKFSASGPPVNAPVVGLDIDALSLSAKLRFPLSGQLDATWWLGMSSAEFDVDGTLQIPMLIATVPSFEQYDPSFFNPFPSSDPLTDSTRVSDFPIASAAQYEFVDPDDEVGLLWGFGIDWHLGEKFSVTARYIRHDVKLLDIDTFNVGVMYSL
ncbi:MAG: outer membrane beta-barrel protein [Pseudomonadales bacterium]|nr:outer membrane beta-barrel protein [Pseudomonadales bacterium]